MLVEKGTIISVLINPDEPKEYMVSERLDDFGHGDGGWLCVDLNVLSEQGADSISPFDCWRVTDKYLEMQIQRGVIQIIDKQQIK
jgi:hypothetical protein